MSCTAKALDPSPSTKFVAAIAPGTAPTSTRSTTPLSALHSSELTLHFTGENAISSAVFRLFLEVATTYTIPSTPQAEDKILLGPLLSFLERWKCTALHSLVMDKVFRQIENNDMFPLQAFNIGAVTNNRDMCKAALSTVSPASRQTGRRSTLGTTRETLTIPGTHGVGPSACTTSTRFPPTSYSHLPKPRISRSVPWRTVLPNVWPRRRRRGKGRTSSSRSRMGDCRGGGVYQAEGVSRVYNIQSHLHVQQVQKA